MKRTARVGFSLLDAIVGTCVLVLAVAIALPALKMASADAAKQTCTNNLKTLSSAFQQYSGIRQGFPPRRTGLGGKLPFGGWGVQIIPFIEPELADAFNPDYDYYDPINQDVSRQTVDAFLCPASPKDRKLVVTASASVSSRNTDRASVFSFEPGLNDFISSNGMRMPSTGYGVNWPSGTRGNRHQAMTDDVTVPFHLVSDGLSNTLLIVEKAGLPDPWRVGKMTGEGSPLGAELSRGAWAGFGSIQFSAFDRETGEDRGKGDASDCAVNCNNFFGIYGFHPEGANILLCDGSVRFVTPELDGLTFARLTTRDDGQPIDPTSF
ncbi:DUF1559 domain-containing protein [Bremerella sp. JC817]|uniref:DUF1559 family PulG-like putative transporter n=1 Tax=Bremerella sp. JC817 TaxID=3231756 RepID=UPI00345A97EE